MEGLEPKTANGKQLNKLLTNWIEKFPQIVMDKFERVLLMYAFRIKNDDAFIASLYGQNVLDEKPLNLRQHLTTNLLRVQHAVEVACGKMHLKEIVVALEWSENENVLAEILKWAEETLSKILEKQKPVDLAPEKVKKPVTSSSLPSIEAIKTVKPRNVPQYDISTLRKRRTFSEAFKEGSLEIAEQRDREIILTDRTERPAVVQACRNKIIIGLVQGPVLLYNSTDLKCDKRLSHRNLTSKVACFHCTCVEIIVGYEDGNICVWNIQNESLVRRFSAGNRASRSCYATSMRLRGQMCVAVTAYNTVRIWKFGDSSSVTAISKWKPDVGLLKRIDIRTDDEILLVPNDNTVLIYNFSGQLQRRLSSSGFRALAINDECEIAAGADKVIRVLSATSGQVLKNLHGHDGPINYLSTHDNFLISQEAGGTIVIWNIDAALKGLPAALVRLKDQPCLNFYSLSLGQDFFVRKGSLKILVTDFL